MEATCLYVSLICPFPDPETAFCEKGCKGRRDAHRPGGRQSPGCHPATPQTHQLNAGLGVQAWRQQPFPGIRSSQESDHSGVLLEPELTLCGHTALQHPQERKGHGTLLLGFGFSSYPMSLALGLLPPDISPYF